MYLWPFSGDLKNWWSPEVAKNYWDKAKCFVDQYGGYKSEQVGLNLNGYVTLEENIADNGGIKMAYNAYCEYTSVICTSEDYNFPSYHFLLIIFQ